MAIQFQCPSCEATIRVPDAAAGKKGTCPRCNEKLLVPNVGRGDAAPSSTAATERPLRQPPPNAGLPQLDPLEEPADDPGRRPQSRSSAGSPGLPPLSDAPSHTLGSPARQKSRTQRGPNHAAWIVPAICILGVVGFVGWFMWKAQPRLAGELVAHVARDADPEPGLIPAEFSGLEQDELDEVLETLKTNSANWGGPLMRFTLFGSKQGVKVSVRNGQATHFVTVAVSQHAALVEYTKDHAEELGQSRLAALEKHAPALYAAWKKYFDEQVPIKDQTKYRDTVLIPAMVAGLGYHLEAKVNGNSYPCIAEESNGTLYFLLPNATKSFDLVGRDLPDGPRVPANFHVKLATDSKPAGSRKKSRGRTAAEREANNPGMNPELHDSEGDEQPSKPVQPSSDDKMDDEMPAKSRPKRKSRAVAP